MREADDAVPRVGIDPGDRRFLRPGRRIGGAKAGRM